MTATGRQSAGQPLPKKKMKTQAAISRQNLADIVEDIANTSLAMLVEQWLESQRALQAVTSTPLNDSGEQAADIETRLQAIGLKQLEIVRSITLEPAHSKAGVLAKLTIWSELSGHGDNDTDWLPPSDQIVISVLEDLRQRAA